VESSCSRNVQLVKYKSFVYAAVALAECTVTYEDVANAGPELRKEENSTTNRIRARRSMKKILNRNLEVKGE
jgi:hypothetical protein